MDKDFVITLFADFLLSESVEGICKGVNAFLVKFTEVGSFFFSFSFVIDWVWLDVAVSLNFLNKKSGFVVFFRLFDVTVEIGLSCNCWLLLEFSLVANPARPLTPLVIIDEVLDLPLLLILLLVVLFKVILFIELLLDKFEKELRVLDDFAQFRVVASFW